jgi:hypothetical protein
MRKNIGSVDGLTRALGGVPLLIGATLALPGIDGRTVETAALWIALLVGMVALIAAFAGKCSWFAGVLITGVAYFLFVLRSFPHAGVQTAAASVGIIVGATALFTRATRHCPVNAAFRIHSA